MSVSRPSKCSSRGRASNPLPRAQQQSDRLKRTTAAGVHTSVHFACTKLSTHSPTEPKRTAEKDIRKWSSGTSRSRRRLRRTHALKENTVREKKNSDNSQVATKGECFFSLPSTASRCNFFSPLLRSNETSPGLLVNTEQPRNESDIIIIRAAARGRR